MFVLIVRLEITEICGKGEKTMFVWSLEVEKEMNYCNDDMLRDFLLLRLLT